MTPSPRQALPLTAECAFWASLMVSWVAQDSEGLLDIDAWAVGLIGFFALALTGVAFGAALRRPWIGGSMKLTSAVAKLMFVTMLVVTAAWVVFGVVYARTSLGQGLYGASAILAGWSAIAIFVALRVATE